VTFGTFLANTLLVCVLGVVGSVLSNAIIAYGLAKIRWRGREALFAVTLATMMVPFPVLMVPLYGVFKGLGWIGTLQPLWVPAFFGGAFNIFLMRQFFRTIPEELSEAARIDGCNEWQIFWRIVLPLSKPVLAVVALFHFLWAWNDFLGPLLFLTRKETFTLALALQNYQSQSGGVQWHHLMAASTVIVAPIIVLFFLTQKTFIKGIATTGLKG
jgi:multiple sugar transport system permease protein